MASTTSNGSLPPNFFLTPQQQNLLFAALNSNRQQQQQRQQTSPANNMLSLSPTSLTTSPGQKDSFQESPFLDNYDYDVDPDSSFDFDFSGTGAKMIGDLPGTARSESTENEIHDKRSHPDDDDEDEGSPDSSSGGNGNKRRESTEKVSKKPGRKPLTTEPTSKRKAQNRAAQRAFRERKEKHLKDLETKVSELEKASEEANHENKVLRAQVDRMTSEIDEYKKKISVMSSGSRSFSGSKTSGAFGSAAISNLADVNFQFEFPKFGMLPGPPANKQSRSSTSASLSPPSLIDFNTGSPSTQSNGRSPISLNTDSPAETGAKDDLAKLSGVYNPPLTNNTTLNASRGNSLDSLNFNLGPTSTSSPSASSASNRGPSSSCGTSPEPFTQSPIGFKPIDTMATIGEEQPSTTNNNQVFSAFTGLDFGTANFDWLAQQNGGQFEPQLFGGYREPQENILANATFDDSFFNDALDADFFTPYNMAASPVLPKKDLIAEIDAKNEADDGPEPAGTKTYSHQAMWYDPGNSLYNLARQTNDANREKLQNCPVVQSGDFDLDGLCSELTKKAKCSGKGPVVAEHDFNAAVRKFMGKDAACLSKLTSS